MIASDPGAFAEASARPDGGTTARRGEAEPVSSWTSLLRCPRSGARLEAQGAGAAARLVAVGSTHSHPIDASGVPLFAETMLSDDARAQREHFDRVADSYMENLTYPHTREYVAYLDGRLDEIVGPEPLGTLLEVCCGRGEALALFGGRCTLGLGVDVSLRVLRAARRRFDADRIGFVQADATRLPVADGCVDTVIMLGGIHHVSDRAGLFAELSRVLRPGGRLIFREPVDDFLPWRAIRSLVYRVSPALDADTEEPLRRRATERDLAAAGLALDTWRTFGFVGFCLFMNSDVLVFNRAFRHLPGVRRLTRAFARLDDALARRRALAGCGLQVVGVAVKPAP